MLAYSAVTHAGFIAVAVGVGAAGTDHGGLLHGHVFRYGHARVRVALGVRQRRRCRSTGSSRLGMGAGRASALVLGLFSMGGVPPTPGFWAKLAVIVVAWQSAGWLPALIVAAGGVFSLLYYLRPVPDLFATIRAAVPEGELPFGLTRSRGAAVAAVVVAAAGGGRARPASRAWPGISPAPRRQLGSPAARAASFRFVSRAKRVYLAHGSRARAHRSEPYGPATRNLRSALGEGAEVPLGRIVVLLLLLIAGGAFVVANNLAKAAPSERGQGPGQPWTRAPCSAARRRATTSCPRR